MPAFPNYYNSDTAFEHRGILKEMDENWSTHSNQNQYFQGQAEIDVRFYVGDQAVFRDLYSTELPYRRQIITVNLTKRLVELAVGYQLDNRKSITTVPIEGSDQLTSDQFTKILMWNDRQASIPELFSEAFKGTCITGLNWVSAYMDYSTDPVSGDIGASIRHFNQVIFDPFFSKIDMTDCDFWWSRDYITKDQAYALLPGYEELVDSMKPRGTRAEMDGKFQYTPQSVFSSSEKLLTYDEYWRRSYRKQKLLINEGNGTTFEWNSSDSDLREYKAYLQQNFPDDAIRVMEHTVPSVRRAFVLNGTVVKDEGRPYGLDIYGAVPIMGYFTPQSLSLQNKIQGIVRGARDPQFLFNKFLISAMDNIDAQQAGFIAKEDSVVNPKSLHKTGPGQVVWRKKDTTPEDVQKMEPATPSAAQMQMTETLSKLMIDTTGINETNLGLSDDKVAGVLNMLNQRAGMTTLNSLYDNLDKAMKLFGRIRLKLIQANFLPEKIKRIINEEPSPQFYERAFGKYDIAVEDGYDTSTQRQLAFAQSIKLKEIIPSIPDSWLIKKSTLQDKNELVEMLEQQEKSQAEQAQAQSQVAMEEQKATIDMATAQAQYQRAGAVERKSRILENAALAIEREGEADKDREQALLNKVRALKELQDIDITQIERLLAIAQTLEQRDLEKVVDKSAQQRQVLESVGETPPSAGLNQ